VLVPEAEVPPPVPSPTIEAIPETEVPTLEPAPTVEALPEAEAPASEPAPTVEVLDVKVSVDSIINVLEAKAVAKEKSEIVPEGKKRPRAEALAPVRVGSRARKQPERLKY